MKRLAIGALVIVAIVVLCPRRLKPPLYAAEQQQPVAASVKPPQVGSARANAPVDLTGYWVALITEDWRYRMVTPPKGDTTSVPTSIDAREAAGKWDPSKEGSCLAYGAAGIMRMPLRVHITWEDDYTLKLETDVGQQTRWLRFRPPTPAPAEKTLQGRSAAEWMRAGGGGFGFGGFAGFGGGAQTGRRWAPLKVVTTQLSGGWLRRNGVPYSDSTTVTEYFLRLSDGEDEWLTVSTTVEDPKFLISPFITSSNFRREPDGSKWRPSPCKAD
jgi:hypothetical protein